MIKGKITTNFFTKGALAAALFLSLNVSGGRVFPSEIKITPVADVTAGGGQYFYSGSASNGLIGDIYVSPVVNFTPKTALLPIYIGSYRGTKDVRELVGGGTLTQETQDHALTVRFITSIAQETIKLRARAGYKIEYVKETKDETWGKGLFDYARVLGGIEAEKFYSKSSVKVGLDFYQMKYPNYQSLITNTAYQTSLDTTTYTELSTNAGKDVLDNNNLALSVLYTRSLSDAYALKLGLDVVNKNFTDQRVVESNGLFSSTLRKDIVTTLTGSVSGSADERIRVSLSDSIQSYNSNQNSYDASGAKFISSYYDYVENTFSPSVSFYLGEFEPRSNLTIYAELSHRFYRTRPAQNLTGGYLSENTYQATQTAGIVFKYPLTKNFSVRVSGNYRVSFSNMKYENNYKYNYDVYTYFAGINYTL